MNKSVLGSLRRLGLAITALVIAACDSGDDATQLTESIYADDSLLLCKSAITKNLCLSLDLTTAVSRAEGSFIEPVLRALRDLLRIVETKASTFR
ncbi:MAG: hypothetical protein AAF542_00230 [Pseudomonadota bacterium]